MEDDSALPKILCIVGVDGCGKTTLAQWLSSELFKRDIKSVVVWSRFRNYLSKPLLALTRLTGHNHFRTYSGVRFGIHNFESLKIYRELFALLQAIDVNLGAYWYISRRQKKGNLLICERGPWDTVVDVISDTGLESMSGSLLEYIYTFSLRKNAKILLISRSYDKILANRPELINDHKLSFRIKIYEQLASMHGWSIVDNNATIEAAQEKICIALGLIK